MHTKFGKELGIVHYLKESNLIWSLSYTYPQSREWRQIFPYCFSLGQFQTCHGFLEIPFLQAGERGGGGRDGEGEGLLKLFISFVQCQRNQLAGLAWIFTFFSFFFSLASLRQTDLLLANTDNILKLVLLCYDAKKPFPYKLEMKNN